MQKAIQDLRETGTAQAADRYEERLVPTGAGTERAAERGVERAIRQRELYADTPSHPTTRQQRRAGEQHKPGVLQSSGHTYNRKTRRLLAKKGWDGEPIPGKSSSELYHADALQILLTHNVSRHYTRS